MNKIKGIGKEAYDKVLEKYFLGYVDWLEEKLIKQLTIPVFISCFYCKEDLKSDEIEVNNRVKYEQKTCRKCYSKHNL